MKKTTCLLALMATLPLAGVQAQSDYTAEKGDQGHAYIGLGASSLGLDNNRVPGVKTSSPGHASRLGHVLLGYQFSDSWAADISAGATMNNNVEVDALTLNGYRFFGSGRFRPYLSAGLSQFSVDDALNDSTQQYQAGLGLAANLSRNLELRVGYQTFNTFSGDHSQDNSYGATLSWHFSKPPVQPVAQAKPQPVLAQPVPPQPAPAPEERVEIERIELQVLFDFDKSIIKSVYEPQLTQIAQLMISDPQISAIIEGHTDSVGTDEYNLNLSKRRANAIKQRLVNNYGISPDRIETIGYGESQPIADNSTAAGAQKNRRAIAVILRSVTVSE